MTYEFDARGDTHDERDLTYVRGVMEFQESWLEIQFTSKTSGKSWKEILNLHHITAVLAAPSYLKLELAGSGCRVYQMKPEDALHALNELLKRRSNS